MKENLIEAIDNLIELKRKNYTALLSKNNGIGHELDIVKAEIEDLEDIADNLEGNYIMISPAHINTLETAVNKGEITQKVTQKIIKELR